MSIFYWTVSLYNDPLTIEVPSLPYFRVFRSAGFQKMQVSQPNHLNRAIIFWFIILWLAFTPCPSLSPDPIITLRIKIGMHTTFMYI